MPQSANRALKRKTKQQAWEAMRGADSTAKSALPPSLPDIPRRPAPLDKAFPASIRTGDPLNRADSIGLIGVLVGTFFVLITPTVLVKLPAFGLLCFGSAYFVWLSHWSYHLNRLWRLALILAALVSLCAYVAPQFMKQWRSEHMQSELTSKASAPGVVYPDGDHHGIKWYKAFSEVRLDLTSRAAFPIQNLNLSVASEDPFYGIAGIAQLDQIEGCVIRRPRGGFPNLSPVILSGNDGSRSDISPEMNDLMASSSPFRDHYDLLCQRILAGESISLIIGSFKTSRNGDMLDPPSRIRIRGDYETTAAEGSRRVLVNEVVTVSILPRWK